MSNVLDSHVKAYQRQSIYDFDNTIQLNWYPQRIMELSQGARSILELGLGHGITTETFFQHFKRHVVIDASPAVIENFGRLYPTVQPEIVETHFEHYHTEERFDVIVFGYILEHVDNPVEVLAHFNQFLAPAGKLFVTVPNAESLNRRLGHLAGLLPDLTTLSEHDRLLGHKRYYTVDTLRADIGNAGYHVVRMEGIYLKPFTTHQILSLNLDQTIIEALCKVATGYPELSCSILVQMENAKTGG
jgi:2-polyprenyl-3-methyl-5-hydroxy-6-metoxy-1,4-benzoquinol methylase